MFLIIRVFLFIFCLSTPFGWGTIVEINNLKPFQAHVQKLNSNALVVVDVDATLYIPTDAILQPANENKKNEWLREMSQNPDVPLKKKWVFNYISSKVLQKRQVKLVNPDSPAILCELQQGGIRSIALTAMHGGEYGAIPSMEGWRYDELARLGFDFSYSFPQFPQLDFLELNQKDSKPRFYKGILASAAHPKGEVLQAFLEKIDWHPSEVVFLDDQLKMVQSVDAAMTALGIPVTAYHYREVELLPSTYDHKVANAQAKHLLDEGEWLSDKEASER